MRLPLLLLAAGVAACATATPETELGTTVPNSGEAAARTTGDGARQATPADRSATEPRYVQAGAPGQDSRELSTGEVASLDLPGHSDADIRFVQAMIPHHAQAIDMVALMPARTTNDRLRRLGGRIEISQRDEIALMKRWLRDRGESVPGEGGETGHEMAGQDHGGMHGGLMPGMLTPEQMDRLAAAEGVAFDRLFLELMIGHHQGALVMVEELFSTPGGGQESWVYQFASDVDADQEMEIRRMRQMLTELR